MSIGSNIRKIREEKGWTQKKLAEKLDIRAPHFNRIETDKVSPSINTIISIAKTLEVSIDYLVSGDENDLREIKIEDKDLLETVKLIENLNEEEKQAVITVINAMLTKTRMKQFLEKELKISA